VLLADTPNKSRGSATVHEHKFMDKTNIFLTAAEIAALTVDGYQTQEAINPHTEYFWINNQWVPVIVRHREGDPIARPFVNAGWPGQIAGGTLFIGADVALRYLLHRKKHHRAERMLPLIIISYGTACSIHNAQMSRYHR
jgi:hypothetical protein